MSSVTLAEITKVGLVQKLDKGVKKTFESSPEQAKPAGGK
jgi:hypothetical protein